MTIATTIAAGAGARSAGGRDWPFLVAAVAATAVLVALVALDGQPASAALILGGFGLGVAFLRAEFGFTAAWRRFIVRGEAGGLIATLVLTAVAAIVIVPVAALVPGFGGTVAPLGPSLVIGALVFGIGMQLANGCGSGTLYAAGGGSGRMLVTLAFFIAGSVLGSLHLPAFYGLGAYAAILGGLSFIGTAGIVGGPSLTGFLYDRTGSYAVPFMLFVGAAVLGGVLMLFASRPAPVPAREPIAR